MTALDDVGLRVERGQVMGVVGPSGSGKSTLARIVNLLERPSAGTVTVDGVELTTLGAADLDRARRGIGMIFQQFNLLDSRTVLANVELPLELAGVGRRERRTRAAELLERVGLGARARLLVGPEPVLAALRACLRSVDGWRRRAVRKQRLQRMPG